MKLLTVLIGAILISACDRGANGTPVTPSPVTVAPPPAPAPAPTPAPTPFVFSYAGFWSGNYIINRCLGQGSLEDLFCSAPSGGRPGGIYPVGSRLPITLDLTQNGTSVSGLVSFGSVRGPMSGTVRSNGLLTMSGNAASGNYTMSITYWDTGVYGDELGGYISFTTRYAGINGFATVETQLSGVRR